MQEAGEFEAFQDMYFGLYIFRTEDVPTSYYEMSRNLWTSEAAYIYVKKAGVPCEVADILRVGGKSNTIEAVSLALKDSTTICGHHGRRTAIKEIIVLEQRKKDNPLDFPHLHPGDGTQYIHLKSIIMSTASSAELALDEDLSLVSYQMCQQSREIHISRLRQLAQGADIIYKDKQGRPPLSLSPCG